MLGSKHRGDAGTSSETGEVVSLPADAGVNVQDIDSGAPEPGWFGRNQLCSSAPQPSPAGGAG